MWYVLPFVLGIIGCLLFIPSSSFSQDDVDLTFRFCTQNWRENPDMCKDFIPEGYYDKTAPRQASSGVSVSDTNTIPGVKTDVNGSQLGLEGYIILIVVIIIGSIIVVAKLTRKNSYKSEYRSSQESTVGGYSRDDVIEDLLRHQGKDSKQSSSSWNANDFSHESHANFGKFTVYENDLKNNFSRFSGHQMEEIVGGLLKKKGYDEVRVTPGSGDFGVDIWLKKGGDKTAVQVKHQKDPVGHKVIIDTLSNTLGKTNKILIISTRSDFTPNAYKDQKDRPFLFELWNKDKFHAEIKRFLA